MVTKNEFIGKVAVDAGFSQDAVRKVFNSIEKLLLKNLSRGDKVKLSGLGTFSISEISERKGRNPRDGSTMTIPAHNRIKFSPSINTRGAINS